MCIAGSIVSPTAVINCKVTTTIVLELMSGYSIVDIVMAAQVKQVGRFRQLRANDVLRGKTEKKPCVKATIPMFFDSHIAKLGVCLAFSICVLLIFVFRHILFVFLPPRALPALFNPGGGLGLSARSATTRHGIPRDCRGTHYNRTRACVPPESVMFDISDFIFALFLPHIAC